MDNIHNDNTNPLHNHDEVVALQAEITRLQSRCDSLQRTVDTWRSHRDSLLDAVNAVVAYEVDLENPLEGDWERLLSCDGVEDPRTCTVTVTFTVTRTETAEITVTLTDVKRSESDSAQYINGDDVSDWSDRRDIAAGLVFEVDYTDIEVTVDSHEFDTDISYITVESADD